MSLESLKVSELKKVAEEYAVDISEAKNKLEILAILAEEGVTDDLMANLAAVEKEELPPPPVFKGADVDDTSDVTLVKMERDNRSYQTHGYEFTRDHPFVSMPMSTAMKIFDTQKGFRLATPQEVTEYYS